jgi:hypothetical protein
MTGCRPECLNRLDCEFDRPSLRSQGCAAIDGIESKPIFVPYFVVRSGIVKNAGLIDDCHSAYAVYLIGGMQSVTLRRYRFLI